MKTSRLTDVSSKKSTLSASSETEQRVEGYEELDEEVRKIECGDDESDASKVCGDLVTRGSVVAHRIGFLLAVSP